MSTIQAISNVTPEAVAPQAVSTTQSTGFSDTINNKLKVPADLNTIFEEAAQKYNVPSTLLKAVGKAESDFNTRAVSRCGAQGVMQLMPATARGLGVTDSFDPRQNIMGGAKYLSQMLKKYNGNTKLALAAYNAGSNNVDKYNGVPPFKETQNYVVKVMKYAGEGMVTVPTTRSSTNSTNSVYASSSGVASPIIRNSSYDASSDSYYRNIIDSITSFDDFTTDDYLMFIELLKSSLQTSSMGQLYSTPGSLYASGVLGSRYQTMF